MSYDFYMTADVGAEEPLALQSFEHKRREPLSVYADPMTTAAEPTNR